MTEPWLPNCLFSLEAQQMERVSEADDINIEMLEQKVKIYRKKGKEAKALKALEEIDRLKRAKVAVNPAPKKVRKEIERERRREELVSVSTILSQGQKNNINRTSGCVLFLRVSSSGGGRHIM